MRLEVIHEIWKPVIEPLLNNKIIGVLNKETTVPTKDNVFRALLQPPEDIKVVILGLEPYSNNIDSCGLAYSTETGKISPSLKTIFIDLLKSELSTTKRVNTDLSDWETQGVLLLNIILTAAKGQALAHADIGWQKVTGAVIQHLVKSPNPIVFMVWGDKLKTFFEAYSRDITNNKLVLYNCHPMLEFYGRTKFTKKNHFAIANDFLISHNLKPIIWDGN